MKQGWRWTAFLESIAARAVNASSDTFLSKPWWRATNRFTQRSLIREKRKRGSHEGGHCPTLQPQPHPGQEGYPLPSGNGSQRGGCQTYKRTHYVFAFS